MHVQKPGWTALATSNVKSERDRNAGRPPTSLASVMGYAKRVLTPFFLTPFFPDAPSHFSRAME